MALIDETLAPWWRRRLPVLALVIGAIVLAIANDAEHDEDHAHGAASVPTCDEAPGSDRPAGEAEALRADILAVAGEQEVTIEASVVDGLVAVYVEPPDPALLRSVGDAVGLDGWCVVDDHAG